jgi:hypothetical protein
MISHPTRTTDYLDARREGLKGKWATTEEDSRMRGTECKTGELTLENEIWKTVTEEGGLEMPPLTRPQERGDE